MTSHFLFVIWEGGGTIPPELALAKRLLDRGHEVTVLGERASQQDIEAIDAQFVPYQQAPQRLIREDHLRDWEKSNPLSMAKNLMDNVLCGPARAYAMDVLSTIKKINPDALVVDGSLLGALIGAEKSSLPTAIVNPDVGFRPVKGRPPLGLGLPKARSMLGRIRDRLLNYLATRASAVGLPPINACRRSLDLPTLRSPFDLYARADRHLLLTSRHFDFPTQPPSNLRYVGPQVDDPIWGGDWTPPWPDNNRASVLVTLGSTFQNQAVIYRRIITALRALNLNAIVTLGNVAELPSRSALGEDIAGENIYLVASAPHSEVLKHVDLVVSHCGHGTVMKSLCAAIPLVCIPLGRDQKDNAQRVEAIGVGLKLRRTASTEKIKMAIDIVLKEARFKNNALQLSKKIAQEMEDDPAIQELEKLLH